MRVTTEEGKVLTGKRILVVEDEFLIARDFTVILGNAGAQAVGPVGRVDQALDLVRSEQIDGAILDIVLHDETSYPVADALKKRNIPFLFISGYNEANIEESYRETILVRKPCLPQQLLNALMQLYT